MNYLAHAYLSFSQPDILVGNLISDFVKGKKKFDYPTSVQQGIGLHRSIDHFTDHHEATRHAKQILKPDYGLYAGAFIDVVYDHFLANDTKEFSQSQLAQFAQWVYDTLENYASVLPPAFSAMFPYMKRHNWLNNYGNKLGVERSFAGIARRATYLTESETAFSLFEKHYDMLHHCYDQFFPEVKKFAFAEMTALQQKQPPPITHK